MEAERLNTVEPVEAFVTYKLIQPKQKRRLNEPPLFVFI
jgi:hypothetical protein